MVYKKITIGSRLREERERLKLTQSELAEVGGVNRVSQSSYEADKRSPDTSYLQAIAAAGCDVQYIITGVKSAQVQIAEPPKNYAVLNRAKAEKLLDNLPPDMLQDVLKYLEDKNDLAACRAEIEKIKRERA